MTKMIEVSVIITTRNEEKHIKNCLQSIKDQKFDQNSLEIIVVDNNSIDRTKFIAAEFTSNVFNLGPERSAQRNFGVRKSQGKYILYLDADMILAPLIISECVKKCEDDDLVALYIPERIIGESFWNKVRNFERSFYNATDIDCVRFVLRDIFNKLKGFDLSMTGPEDWDFDRRTRELGKTGITSTPLSHNEGLFKLTSYLVKKGYYCRTFDIYIKKWGSDDSIIKKQLGFYYRFFGVFFENGKWKKLIFHPVLALGMYFLRGLVGLMFVLRKVRKKN